MDELAALGVLLPVSPQDGTPLVEPDEPEPSQPADEQAQGSDEGTVPESEPVDTPPAAAAALLLSPAPSANSAVFSLPEDGPDATPRPRSSDPSEDVHRLVLADRTASRPPPQQQAEVGSPKMSPETTSSKGWWGVAVVMFQLGAGLALVALVLLGLVMHDGCVPSENADEWSSETLQAAKGYLGQLRMDVVHIQNLYTDMSYLQAHMEWEQGRRRQEGMSMFAYQEEEINKTAAHIEMLRETLLQLPSEINKGSAPAVKNATVLTCDWLNVNRTEFGLEPKGSDANRGCHVEIDYGQTSGSAKNYRVDLGQTKSFGCFDADGIPQGCHRHVEIKINRLRMKAGCASRNILDWGWCGCLGGAAICLPGSHLFSDMDSEYAEYGCTTLGDWGRDIILCFWSWATCYQLQFLFVNLGVGKMASSRLQKQAVAIFEKRLKKLQESSDEQQKSLTELQRRDEEREERGFINRVSLSLNILEPQPDGKKPKLKLRTLWEKDLDTDVITDKETREEFTKRAKEAGERDDDPFLMDPVTQPGESSPGQDAPQDWVGMIVNLFGNHISAACSNGFILQDVHGPTAVEEVPYVFGITFEKQKRTEQSEHVKKVRVLLMRESSLVELNTMKNITQVQLQSDSKHHAMRFHHLQKLATHWEWKKAIR
eukprot:COSAG06_NODE_1550_length_9129_cov_4.644408_6_plen_656_part_00